MTVEAGLPGLDFSGLVQEISNTIRDSIIRQLEFWHQSRLRAAYAEESFRLPEDSILTISYSVRKPIWAGDVGFEVGKFGTVPPPSPGTPSDASPSSPEPISTPFGGQ